MADKKKNTNSLIDFIQKGMNKLYQNTYYSQPSDKLDLEHIKSDIDNSLNKLSDNTKQNTGLDSIAGLYQKLGNNTDSIGDDIDKIFGNKAFTEGMFLSSFSDNKCIKEQDDEIDAICKYMPKLLYALDAKQDNVLSSDHNSKDFLNVRNCSSSENDDQFKERIKELKKKYKLIDVINDAYSKTSKYGEDFTYTIPYKKALEKLLKTKDATSAFTGISEAAIDEAFATEKSSMTYDFKKSKILYESGSAPMYTSGDKTNANKIPDGFNDMDIPSLEVEFNNSGVLESAFKDMYTSRKILKEAKTVPDDIKFEGIDSSSSEGIITTNKKEKDNTVTVPGCIVKSLPRENIIPIYLDNNLCLGYYCIENDMDEYFPKGGSIDPMLSARTGNFKIENGLNDKKDTLLKFLSNSLSKQINAKFINANQDLTKEIYTVLKSNEMLNGTNINRLKITYISPSDIIHWYWKKDERTNRGISDLEKALLPAKMYVGLYTSNITGYLTRGFDKRVYYVKQGVERNISKTLINVINQIKKANFGAREMTNLKHILSIQGRYNDLVIPINSGQEPPVQFEIMPGQQIDLQTDFLDMLEEKAISATDVPYEYVQSRQTVDYAVRLTMASGRFIKTTYVRQSSVEEIASELLTRIYDAEYNSEDRLEVILPPPTFLSIVNTSTMLENTNQLIDNIIQTESDLPDDTEYTRILNKNLKRHYLSTYIDYDDINEIKIKSMMEYKKNKAAAEQQ